MSPELEKLNEMLNTEFDNKEALLPRALRHILMIGIRMEDQVKKDNAWIRELRNIVLADDEAVLDRMSEASMRTKMAQGWQIPGPGSTYDNGYAEGLKDAFKMILGEI